MGYSIEKDGEWDDVAVFFEQLGRALSLEWDVRPPLSGSLPSQELEAVVDGWCERLAENLGELIDPPDDVKPWILARVHSMQSTALLLARQGDGDCPGLSPSTARAFLIDEWHGALRERWQGLMNSRAS